MSQDGLERLSTMAAIDPPPGAKERVRAALDRRRHEGSRRATRPVAIGALVLVALIAGVVVALRMPSAEPEPEVARGTTTERAPDVETAPPSEPAVREALAAPAHEPIALADGESLALPAARVTARGVAALDREGEALVLHEGAVALEGHAQVAGGACRVDIDGRADVERVAEPTPFSHTLRVVVLSGTASALSAPAYCEIELDEPDAPSAHGEQPRRQRGARDAPVVDGTTPVEDAALARQVETYRAAIALVGRDDASAVAALRAMRAEWPRSPLTPEVDFQIVRALVRLGRTDEARAAAQQFVRNHPRSPRRSEMQRLLE
jgi:hypothetical protein